MRRYHLTPERWAQIEELFHRAAECGPVERGAILDETCGNDHELRREVESLLSCDAGADDSVRAVVRAELDTIGFPLTGETISHYRILDGLGGGGMGLVYRAEDIKLGRRVALKFLPEESTDDPAALARFEREARSASALEHPNICTIYEFGEHEKQPFLVMQLLEGQTLSELFESENIRSSKSDSSAGPHERHTMALDRILDLGVQIASGLEAAHQKGIIHRDIKPANIFVTSHGQAKILDFGLAKLVHGITGAADEPESEDRNDSVREHPLLARNLSLSRAGAAIGTAGYMSPEQVRGEPLDARTDLFSFGLVLYEMATGQRAFQGDTGPELHIAILTQTLVPARQLNPKLPVKLEQVIAKALEKNRDFRYQTLSEMRADLVDVKREMERRNPIRSWMAASALVFALLIITTFLWFAKRHSVSTQAPQNIKFRQLTISSSENPVLSGSISPNGNYLAYVDRQGMHIKDIGTSAIQAVAPPREAKENSVTWDIVQSSWFPDNDHFLANAHPASEDSSAWSSRTASIWIFSRAGEAPRKLRENALAWSVSPDGTLISFGTHSGARGEREIWLVGRDGQHARKLFDTDENSSLGGFLWSADGGRGVYFRTDASGDSLLSRDLRGGAPVKLFDPDETKKVWGGFTWLPDGRLIYQVGDPGSAPEPVKSTQDVCNFWILQLDTHTGKPRGKPKQLTNWTGFCSTPANATADGKRLTFFRTATAWTVDVADLEAGGARMRNLRHFTLDESTDFLQGWTNDSKQIIFVSSRTGQFAIYKQPLDEGGPERLSTGTLGFRDTPESPDGKWVFGIADPQSSDPKGPSQLMRVPLEGGAPELVTTISAGGIFCAMPPSRLCVVGERTEDRRHLVFTSVDPAKGRGRELASFDLDPKIEFVDFSVSLDGLRIAATGNPHGPIHILSLLGNKEQVIPAKFNNLVGDFFWSADGNGLYVPDQTEHGTVLSLLDLNGKTHVLWVNPSHWATWARPSPDGRHLAIEHVSATSNIWMMEDF